MTNKKVILLMALCALFAFTAQSQKYKSRVVNFSYYEFPKTKLDTATYHNYSVSGSLPDYMGGSYALSRQSYLIGNLRRNAQPGGDIEVLLNFGYYTEDNYARPALQTGSQKVKVNGRDTSVPVYSYQGSFYQPYEYVLRDNVKGQDLLTVANRKRLSCATDWYRNSDEAVRNWENAMRTQLVRQSSDLLREVAGGIQAQTATSFYSGTMKGQAEVYYMKDKDDYADLDSAAQVALAAYPLITAEQGGQHNSFAAAIAPAEAIWLRALAQYEPDSKKARINAKAANIILLNLAWASYWKNDFTTALQYADRADDNDKRDGWVTGFLRTVKEKKDRLANSSLVIK